MRALASLLVPWLLAAAPSLALNLTGTWVGGFQCSAFDGAPSSFPETQETLRITQVGDAVNVQWVGVSTLTGVAIADAKSPDGKGEVALADCATGPNLLTSYAELVRLEARVDREKGTGKLVGVSISGPSGAVIEGCRWRFELSDLPDPMVGGCQ